MTTITLREINENMLSLKKEVDEIKELLEESHSELKDEVKIEIDKSRKRAISEFKTQQEIEKKIL